MLPIIRARNNKGFSLIELLISMFIIMISMLALANSTGHFLRVNLDNDIRNTATKLANQTGEALYTLHFSDSYISQGVHNRIPNDAGMTAKGIPDTMHTVRGSRQNFNIGWIVVQKTNEVLEITVTVNYTFRGKTISQNAVIYKHTSI